MDVPIKQRERLNVNQVAILVICAISCFMSMAAIVITVASWAGIGTENKTIFAGELMIMDPKTDSPVFIIDERARDG